MKIAIAMVNGDLAPLFPGVKLKLQSTGNRNNENLPEVTVNGYALTWGQQLKRYNVNLLVCSGVEKFFFRTLRKTLEQCGITLMSKTTGSVSEIISKWRSGQLNLNKQYNS
ncbi:MAG: hypothetical protein PVI26_03700 [Chitinispirillia bacterium]|jgi:predicted Fe-Mo cluster-binding NifX family protein